MKATCPACRVEIPADGINASTDIAHCPSCNQIHRLSELVNPDAARDSEILLDTAPRGTTIRDEGSETIIEASLRSMGQTAFFCFFSGFWNLITSVFVTLAVTRLLNLPPGNTVTEEGTNEPMSVGMAWFMLLFMTPFILVGITTAGIALTTLFGNIRVRFSALDASVATGVGPLRWTRRFDPASVDSIRETTSKFQTNERSHQQITLTAGSKKISFGAMLSDSRRNWLAAVLRQRLTPPN